LNAQFGKYFALCIRALILRKTHGYRLDNAIGAAGNIAGRDENARIKGVIGAANFLGESRDSKRQRVNCA
jgi:hypothetical protein